MCNKNAREFFITILENSVIDPNQIIQAKGTVLRKLNEADQKKIARRVSSPAAFWKKTIGQKPDDNHGVPYMVDSVLY